MKMLYSVEGSEDGLIGVPSSLTKALEQAKNYAESSRSIADARKEFNAQDSLVVDFNGVGSACVMGWGQE